MENSTAAPIPFAGSQVFDHGFQEAPAPNVTPIVFVVDDDVAVRESLELLIRREGWRPETFVSPQDFLRRSPSVVPNCLVLDLSLPGLNGLDLQKRVAIERPYMPVIFIADCVDVPTTVKAMKAGAVEFFMKPFRDDALLSSIQEALERSRAALAHESEVQILRDRYMSLSRREREVMALVVSGLSNKQAGGELGISEITVKCHRGQVMQKMKSNSLAHLVKMAATLDLASASKAATALFPVPSRNLREAQRHREPRDRSMSIIAP